MAERMYFENREGEYDLDIARGFWEGRPAGLSAMVRVKNEAEWLRHSLDSVVAWCDEVAIFLQGEQTDGTDKVAADWALANPGKAAVYKYPFDSLPNGPGHERQPRGSVHERAYFYNWCLAQTCYSHAMKWDGDMVALDWLGPAVREAMLVNDPVSFRGIDIAGADLRYMSIRPHTANEPRVYRVTQDTWYYSGHKCEYFTKPNGVGFTLGDGFLHFKWAKSLDSARKDWPADWRTNPHFQRIDGRQQPGKLYTGSWPACLRQERERRST